jgi:hypothetical protein
MLQRKMTVPEPFRGLARNFMTPQVLGYYKLRRGYAELSTGTGFRHEPIYGVTVRPDPGGQSRMFYDRAEAEAFIASLS